MVVCPCFVSSIDQLNAPQNLYKVTKITQTKSVNCTLSDFYIEINTHLVHMVIALINDT